MKTIKMTLGMILAFLLITAGSYANTSSYPPKDDVATDTLNYTEFKGIVRDAITGNPLPFASVESVGTNHATVTNIDGEFLLKLPDNSPATSFKISYIGYKNHMVTLNDLKNQAKIRIKLEPSVARITELIVRPVEHPAFIREVLAQVKSNYNPEAQMMKGFYRETIKNRRNYVAISEAVVDIYKSGYKNSIQMDQVKIDRGRKSANVEKMDTVLFKLQGGPAVSLLLDVVKNPYSLLSDDFEKVYDFYLENIVNHNNRLHYVVGFKQKDYISDPYYFGRLFIDMDNLAISEAEFSLNVEDSYSAARFFIEKKPIGMSIIPEKATYRTSYLMKDGTWFFNYARAEVRFKVDWDKRLFNSKYTIMTEIAITDRKTDTPEKFSFKDRFKRHEVLDEMVYVYFEPDYWGGYNVIEPDQSIESAIRKLNRKISK